MDHPEHIPNRDTTETQEEEAQRLERAVADSSIENDSLAPTTSAASERLAASEEIRTENEGASEAASRSSSLEKEALQMEKLHRELDSSVSHKLEGDFGRDIGEDRLREAREHSTKFQTHEEYQNGLRAAYPSERDLPNVVGDLRDDVDRYVDAERPDLPRTVAHEQLHSLSNLEFEAKFGHPLNEGTTEHLAREAIPGLNIHDLPEAYPDEERIVGMLEARVGPALAHAYLSGDLEPMRKEFDAQLGDGALDRFAELTKHERFDEAIDLLKGV